MIPDSSSEYLEQDVDVNRRLSLVHYGDMTPLMKVVTMAYDYAKDDTTSTSHCRCRAARRIVQLLLDHGADL
jgi:hypothetical protein